MKKIILGISISIFILGGIIFLHFSQSSNLVLPVGVPTSRTRPIVTYPLSIEIMREKTYPGSKFVKEEILSDTQTYHQYIVSYLSEGLKIYGLLSVPRGNKPKDGWPVILFNHGYIPPTTYQTYPSLGQYSSYFPVFASHGYIVFKPDYRGNGNSQGKPEGAYYSPAYTIDVLNALSSVKQYPDANSKQIGMWGHSMGGNIALRVAVVKPQDIRAVVIWGGVVGSYSELLTWHDPKYTPSAYELSLRNKHKSELMKTYGTPQTNPSFWHAIDPTYYVSDILSAIQIHHGAQDEEVPLSFATSLYTKLQQSKKKVSLYTYPYSNHNITQDFPLAMERSLLFFDTYVKEETGRE